MSLDELIANAQAHRADGVPGDALVVFEEGDEPVRLRALDTGEVHGVDVGGVALFAWEPSEGSWPRKAVILR